MYALRSSAAEALVDARNFAFGDAVAILLDFHEFHRRVMATTLDAGQTLQCKMVSYIDQATYEGRLDIFTKDVSFAYQSELRLALLPGTGAPFQLKVGDLSDIIAVGRLSELNDRLVVSVNSDGGKVLHVRNEPSTVMYSRANI
jgi:hypothetical protein